MAFPDNLLEQAEHLARRERKKPRQASLRRAVSTGYYAIFHLLIAEAIKNWKRPIERFTLARMFDHGTMAKACIAKRDFLVRTKQTDDVSMHLSVIASTFVKMLQDRHAADYDGSRVWSRTEAIERIDSVKEAFQSWVAIRDEPDAQNFLVTLLLKDRKH